MCMYTNPSPAKFAWQNFLLCFLKINNLKQVVTVLRFSLMFSSLLYILINIQHSQVYRNLRWYSRGKTATNISSIYGIEYKIIFKVLHLLSDFEYIKYIAITNSPFIAKLCSCSDITYCQIRALSTARPFFIFSIPTNTMGETGRALYQSCAYHTAILQHVPLELCLPRL